MIAAGDESDVMTTVQTGVRVFFDRAIAEALKNLQQRPMCVVAIFPCGAAKPAEATITLTATTRCRNQKKRFIKTLMGKQVDPGVELTVEHCTEPTMHVAVLQQF